MKVAAVIAAPALDKRVAIRRTTECGVTDLSVEPSTFAALICRCLSRLHFTPLLPFAHSSGGQGDVQLLKKPAR